MASATTEHRFLLIRHGETDFNRAGRYQGQLDIPLNSTGAAQARALARRLAGSAVVRCFTSDLSRACETAREIASCHDIEVERVPELREAHLGVLEGCYWRESETVLADDTAYLRRLDVRARPSGGESPLEVRRRAQRFARRLAAALPNLPGGDIVIVGHGGSLRALIAVLLRLPPSAGWVFRFDNGGLTVIELRDNGQPVLTIHNDRGHLIG